MLVEIEERHKPNSVRDVSAFLTELGYQGYFILDGNLVSMNHCDKDKYQDCHNVGGWKTNWKRPGLYVNNFFFVPYGTRSRLETAVRSVRRW
jgi:hypothetical protein